ncbi:hypothetical protein ALC60_09147 [Trachymyrmex zeteki]|uniref:Uncharacterized protein n=1 Tax=Mycetomoellerius zeteki TaxID=64791 RepID=A0A151WVA8_9HYME|nr:hypothetical protein ALC60_09147 [Trachymyrmex zeteki]
MKSESYTENFDLLEKEYSGVLHMGFESAEVLSSQNNGSSLDCLSMIVQSINGPLQSSSESHYSSHH